jgi:hypothetical protein
MMEEAMRGRRLELKANSIRYILKKQEFPDI